jgi:hypothetical protein
MLQTQKHSSQRLQYTAATLQNRATAMTALFMTVFLLCIEHVRAFANQYHISAHDAMVLASAASSLTRKLGRSYLVVPTGNGVSGTNVAEKRSSSTKLSMAWSIPAMSLPSMPVMTMPTSKDIPIHTLGSWYSEVDPTTKPPVYDE